MLTSRLLRVLSVNPRLFHAMEQDESEPAQTYLEYVREAIVSGDTEDSDILPMLAALQADAALVALRYERYNNDKVITYRGERCMTDIDYTHPILGNTHLRVVEDLSEVSDPEDYLLDIAYNAVLTDSTEDYLVLIETKEDYRIGIWRLSPQTRFHASTRVVALFNELAKYRQAGTYPTMFDYVRTL